MEAGLRLAGALHRFWSTRGHNTEGRDWLERLLQKGTEASAAARAKALLAAGYLAWLQGGNTQAVTLLQESLSLFQKIGDKRSIADSLRGLSSATFRLGDVASSRACLEESLVLSRELRDMRGTAHSLHNLGVHATWGGDDVSARTLFAEALAIHREFGYEPNLAITLDMLARVARIQGDYLTARAYLDESVAINQRLGAGRGLALNLEEFALLAAAQGAMERSARLFGAAESFREAIQVPMAPHERVWVDQLIADVRPALGEEAFATVWAAGRTMTLEAALALALER